MPARREIPFDFAENAALPIPELRMRYQISNKMIARWRRELGIRVPVGAPKRNQNSLNNKSRKKETHGIDGPEAVRTCLSCTRKTCSGSCVKVR